MKTLLKNFWIIIIGIFGFGYFAFALTQTVDLTNIAITGGSITGITDLVVADGGTGLGTINDGFVMLGSGTNAITPLDVTGLGTLIVGDGTTDPTTLALGTGGQLLGSIEGTVGYIATSTMSIGGNAGTVTGFTPASGSLTLAGADALTLTTTGETNSTLPLGTKTLVATDVATLSSLTSVGALNAGSITSGFTSIDLGAGTIDTSGTITGGLFVADSATATSTFAGGLTVQTDALIVQDNSKYVGIGTTTPSNLFSVHGDAYISSDLFVGGAVTATSTVDFEEATVTIHTYPAFSYATSTAWTGTTTRALAPAFTAETWDSVKCFTDTGTLNVTFNDGTNDMDVVNASTTVGAFKFSTSNTFTASEKRYVEIGTPASTPTEISCSVDVIVND